MPTDLPPALGHRRHQGSARPLLVSSDDATRATPPCSREPESASRLLAALWVVVPPIGFSALLHSMDPDVGGVAGLTSPGVAFSVVVVSMPLLLLAWGCLVCLRAGGPAAGGAVLFLSAAVVAVVLTLSGSTADTIGGRLLSFAGLLPAVAACLVTAILPRVLLERLA
jgi:hypothetical protein